MPVVFIKDQVPLGTTKQGSVLDVLTTGPYSTILFQADGEPGEGYVCFYNEPRELPGIGDRGLIVLVEGGPFGVYWDYRSLEG